MKSQNYFLSKWFASIVLMSASMPVFAQDASVDANLQAGAAAAMAALAPVASSQARPHSQEVRNASRQAYLRADANEAAVRQKILARLATAKTPEEYDAAMAEMQDRWLAARDSILQLKAAADTADQTKSAPGGD